MTVIRPEIPGDPNGPRLKPSLTEFLLARIAEDEQWARAAVETPGAEEWHWVRADDDTVPVVDPFVVEYLTEDGDVSLRSVAELRPVSTSDGTLQALPDFAIYSVDDIRSTVAGHIARHDPARVIAECEAKRQQIEHLTRAMEDDYAPWNEKQLRIMAAVYADHADYREEWL